MIVVNCNSCGKRRLLDLNSVTSVNNEHAGIELGYRCSCGGSGTMFFS